VRNVVIVLIDRVSSYFDIVNIFDFVRSTEDVPEVWGEFYVVYREGSRIHHAKLIEDCNRELSEF
jgi:hypothetical protein